MTKKEIELLASKSGREFARKILMGLFPLPGDTFSDKEKLMLYFETFSESMDKFVEEFKDKTLNNNEDQAIKMLTDSEEIFED